MCSSVGLLFIPQGDTPGALSRQILEGLWQKWFGIWKLKVEILGEIDFLLERKQSDRD